VIVRTLTKRLRRFIGFLLLAVCLPTHPALAGDADKPVSFSRDVQPILNRSCVGCHKPGKAKGKLDLSTYAAFRAGGETGPSFVPGEPDKSLVIEQVHGDEPAMPAKGDPLTASDVTTLSTWIRQGAKDDTAATSSAAVQSHSPPVYAMPPVITAVAWSPDGKTIAVGGRNEILLHAADASDAAPLARIPSGSPRTNSLLFTSDGKRLVAAGGGPGQFGEVLAWDLGDSAAWKQRTNWTPAKDYKVSGDTLFGLTLSPDGDRAAFGCADRTARVINLSDGKELLRLEQHTDWVFGAAFSSDGKHLVSAGRDKSVKVTDLSKPDASVEINNPEEAVLSIARHPSEDLIACGGATGGVRLYKTTDLQRRTEEKRDPNRVKELERHPGPVNAVAFSADGKLLATASTGEARVYNKEGNRKAILPGHGGPVFTVAFSPDATRVVTAGYDGKVRVFEVEKGKLLREFVPVPVADSPKAGPAGPALSPR
jgi:WD40 repeat protein